MEASGNPTIHKFYVVLRSRMKPPRVRPRMWLIPLSLAVPCCRWDSPISIYRIWDTLWFQASAASDKISSLDKGICICNQMKTHKGYQLVFQAGDYVLLYKRSQSSGVVLTWEPLLRKRVLWPFLESSKDSFLSRMFIISAFKENFQHNGN